ncbi:transposase-like protein [Rhodoblastus sphagnicola]|nr:transposase-like protein [Rhodoblastus sphagnicola]
MPAALPTDGSSLQQRRAFSWKGCSRRVIAMTVRLENLQVLLTPLPTDKAGMGIGNAGQPIVVGSGVHGLFALDGAPELSSTIGAGVERMVRTLIAVEAEFEAFLSDHAEKMLADGRQRVVRHGHDPARQIQTGIGSVEVQKPKARDRGATSESERIRYSSAILPQWARRTKSLDALLPALYRRGVSAGDFQDVLAALLGKDAPNLSPSVISRLKDEWEDEYQRWQKRNLAARRYVYLWADGVYLQARMEPQAECMLVVIGATPEGKKELVGFQTGFRESAQSWKELLVDLKARGLALAPELAVGDGALGFWKALEEAFPTTQHQRCWFHKTGNVLNKLLKSLQPAGTRTCAKFGCRPAARRLRRRWRFSPRNTRRNTMTPSNAC